MFVAGPTPLDSLLVRRGGAAPADLDKPKTTVHAPSLQSREATDANAGVGVGKGGPSADVEKLALPASQTPTDVPFKPAKSPMVMKRPITHRVSPELQEGLRVMAFYTNRKAQDILAEMIEDGLNKWSPRWREALPEGL
jgi:hypothetical protein